MPINNAFSPTTYNCTVLRHVEEIIYNRHTKLNPRVTSCRAVEDIEKIAGIDNSNAPVDRNPLLEALCLFAVRIKSHSFHGLLSRLNSHVSSIDNETRGPICFVEASRRWYLSKVVLIKTLRVNVTDILPLKTHLLNYICY